MMKNYRINWRVVLLYLQIIISSALVIACPGFLRVFALFCFGFSVFGLGGHIAAMQIAKDAREGKYE